MPTYTFECPRCGIIEQVQTMKETTSSILHHCGCVANKVFLPGQVGQVVVPPGMQATPDKMKYYGVKDIRTGEGITKDTNVQDPPGLTKKAKALSMGRKK